MSLALALTTSVGTQKVLFLSSVSISITLPTMSCSRPLYVRFFGGLSKSLSSSDSESELKGKTMQFYLFGSRFLCFLCCVMKTENQNRQPLENLVFRFFLINLISARIATYSAFLRLTPFPDFITGVPKCSGCVSGNWSKVCNTNTIHE